MERGKTYIANIYSVLYSANTGYGTYHHWSILKLCVTLYPVSKSIRSARYWLQLENELGSRALKYLGREPASPSSGRRENRNT